MPLPEVLVAEFRMAFTAFWIASELLELVELDPDELDCPKSWLNDSVEELPKLDRSELTELVLISPLVCAQEMHVPQSGAPYS